MSLVNSLLDAPGVHAGDGVGDAGDALSGFSSRPTVAASFGAFDGWAAPVDGFIPETSVAPDLPPSPVAPLTHRFLKEISADPGVTSLTMKFACWHKAEMFILPGKC